MKTNLASYCAAILCLAAIQSNAGILAGPITDPANGHDYYLLAPSTWSAAESEAEAMGGTLAIVRNAGEQDWIFSTFADFGDTGRNLWIGLHRVMPGGPFAWMDGTPLDYAHWLDGEPNNCNGNEECVHMRWDPAGPGTWNDLSDANQLNGVVELREPMAKELSQRERALVGNWYESGKIDHPCHIAATDDALYALNDSNNASGRAFLSPKGFLYAASWQVHGEIVKSKILWSNGTWWSRKPASFATAKRFAGGEGE